jgi:hypothetical protein
MTVGVRYNASIKRYQVDFQCEIDRLEEFANLRAVVVEYLWRQIWIAE